MAAMVIFADNHIAQRVELAVIVVIIFVGIDAVADFGDDIFGREGVNFGRQLGAENSNIFIGFGFADE